MDDFISRADAIKKLCEYGIGCGEARIKGVINSIPAADVRPVVLCRDCKWYDPANSDWCCTFVNGPICPTENDFCSFGERREVEE